MGKHVDGEHTIVYGLTGSGKSTWLRYFANAKRHGRVRQPILLVDPKDEHGRSVAGLRTVVKGRPVYRYVIPRGELLRLPPVGPAYEMVDRACADAMAMGDCTLLIDEIDLAHRDEGDKRVPPDNLVRVGAHGREAGVSLVVFCRAPFEIARSVSRHSSERFIFRTDEPSDLNYLVQYGVSRDALRTLPKGACIHYRPASGPPHIHLGPLRGRCAED